MLSYCFLNSLHFFEADTIILPKLNPREVNHLPEVMQPAEVEAGIQAKSVLLTDTLCSSPLS